jgi:hypothetical protein
VFRLNLAMAVVGIGLVYLLTLIGGPAGTAWAICATFAIVVPLWLRKLVNVVGIPVTLRGVTARYADVTSFVRRMADRV